MFKLNYVVILFLTVFVECKKKLVIYSITNSDQEVISSQNLAATEINNDNDLLPDYEINIQLLDAEGSATIALQHAVDLVTNPNLPSLRIDNESVIIPIVLGCPWSSMTIMTAPALNAFHFGQISSSATSIALSDLSTYSNFYRTIPDDSMQSEGIVELCKLFGWDTIGIMHDNDAYGIYLAVGILELSGINNINANTISYQRKDQTSIRSAANSIKNLNVFIIILISHGSDLGDVIDALKVENIWGYPYYYIGVDSWVDAHDVIAQNVEEYAEGYIGTVPWQPGSLSVHDYEGNLQLIYNISLYYQQTIASLWSDTFKTNPSILYNHSIPGAKVVYGWDSMYTVAYALSKFDEMYSLQSIFDDTVDASYVLDKLNDFIVNDIQFLGATGNVTFDEKGDRKNGIYGYGNILPNGTVKYFGYFYENIFKINKDDVVWPSYFLEKNLIPRSSKLITHEVVTVNQILFVFICVLSGVSTLFVLFLMFSTIYLRNESVVKAGSGTLNLFACVGCLLGYCAIILYGIDEEYIDKNNIDSFKVLCNTRIWLLCIAFTVMFVPLFMKTYRLARIFGSFSFGAKPVPDSTLIIGVMICVAVDIIILTVFTAIDPLTRKQQHQSILVIDELQEIEYKIGVCASDNMNETILYLTLGLWKLLELLFGVYVAMVVSRIGLKQLTQFDETGQQVFAITLTVFLITIVFPYLLLSKDSYDVNVKYGMISICGLIACNVASIVNILPRIYAIYYAKIKKDDEILHKFEETFEEKVLKAISGQIKTFNSTSKYRLTLARSTSTSGKMSRIASVTEEDAEEP